MSKKGTKKKVKLSKKAQLVGEKYQATLKTLGILYHSEGETKKEALVRLQPPTIKTFGVLTLVKDGKEQSRVINRVLMYNLFGPKGGVMKDKAIQRISEMFYV